MNLGQIPEFQKIPESGILRNWKFFIFKKWLFGQGDTGDKSN